MVVKPWLRGLKYLLQGCHQLILGGKVGLQILECERTRLLRPFVPTTLGSAEISNHKAFHASPRLFVGRSVII